MTQQTREFSTLERQILDHQTSAVLLFDRHLRLLYINPAGEMMFAISARHILGMKASDVLRCPGHQVDRNLNQVLASGNPFTEREMTVPLEDGRDITVDCSVIPVRDEKGPGEILVELRQLDRQLRISREENLLSQHQAAQTLIRSLAHEIKNPLGGLRGAAQLLERELPDQGMREYTQIVIKEADRLQALVNRMIGPNKVPRTADVNIHKVLERVRQLVSVEAGDAVEISTDYDPSIPPIRGDSDQLIQALLNVARNGARAVKKGGRLIFRTRVLRQFTIGSTRHRLVLRVEIEDDGPGIAKEFQEKIFYPMVSGTEGGLGLGLSIAQSLIHQHRGLIECSSKPGETVFSVYLPMEIGRD